MLKKANNRRCGHVHVVCGPNEYDGPLGGLRVGEAKISLQNPLNIPYFSEPLLNGRRVTLSHRLRGGDSLEFRKLFGHKGAEDRPRQEVETEGLAKVYREELRGMVNEAVESAEARIMDWAEKRFGPPIKEALATLEALAKRLAPADPGLPGRKDSTADIAEYAKERRPGRTWKEICTGWKWLNEDDPRADDLTPNKVYEAYRRHYGDKAKKKKAK